MWVFSSPWQLSTTWSWPQPMPSGVGTYQISCANPGRSAVEL